MNDKPLLKSKTIWFNVLSLLAVAMASLSDATIVTDNPALVAGFAVATSLVNLGLRLVTNQPIK